MHPDLESWIEFNSWTAYRTKGIAGGYATEKKLREILVEKIGEDGDVPDEDLPKFEEWYDVEYDPETVGKELIATYLKQNGLKEDKVDDTLSYLASFRYKAFRDIKETAIKMVTDELERTGAYDKLLAIDDDINTDTLIKCGVELILDISKNKFPKYSIDATIGEIFFFGGLSGLADGLSSFGEKVPLSRAIRKYDLEEELSKRAEILEESGSANFKIHCSNFEDGPVNYEED